MGSGSRKLKAMSLQDKLSLIDEEIRTLHLFCLKSGYTPQEIEVKAAPLLGLSTPTEKNHPKSKTRSRKRTRVSHPSVAVLFKYACLVAIASGILYYDPAYRFVCAYVKLGSMQLLPIWDWSALYDTECFIYNPYFLDEYLTEEDCELCHNVTSLQRMTNVSYSNASQYLQQDFPIIVTDAMANWRAMELFSVKFLSQLYDSDKRLALMMTCNFQSSDVNSFEDARVLLERVKDGKLSHWFANWKNCDKQAARVLRHFFQRPYFVPPMVEMAEGNWLYLSSQYDGKEMMSADFDTQMALFAQVKGTSRLSLTPLSPCEINCTTLYATLKSGEILMAPLRLWMLQYTPYGSGETVAVGLGGLFD